MNEKQSTTDTVFNAIVAFKQENDGCSPSYSWLMEACNIASKSVVFYHIDKLVEDDRLVKGPGKGNLQVVGGIWHYSPGLADFHRTYREVAEA